MKFLYNKPLLWMATSAIGLCAVSCEDYPDEFKQTSGLPVVKYIRVTDPEKADSLITSAYMENVICLVGDNLTAIHEIYFNDKAAVINTSYLTEHTFIVSIPKDIPDEVTNKIYMYNRAGECATYDFNVLVPQPSVRSMSNEWAKPGQSAALIGDYFLDDPNVPLTIMFPGNVEVTEITSITKNRIEFIVPQGAIQGYINVTSIYGTGRSAFQYYDTRNILFDWDGTRGGQSSGHGWRNGNVHQDGDDAWEGIDGAYIYFGGLELQGDAGADWAEDNYSFNYWPEPDNGYPELSSCKEFAEMLASYDVSELQVKFEIYVPSSNPWSSCALQIIFSGNDAVTYNTASNAYFTDTSIPRALWNPWQTSGSYNTGDEWATVSVPFSDFVYTHDGGASSGSINANSLTGLTMFVYHGGVSGTACDPKICIDNIRVVPIE